MGVQENALLVVETLQKYTLACVAQAKSDSPVTFLTHTPR